jgi:hypothetical protein
MQPSSQRSAMPEPFASAQNREPRNWTPIVIAAVVVIAILGGLMLLSQRSTRRASQPDLYAQKLELSDMRFSQARNFVGATVTYLDLRVNNTGERTIAGGQVQLTFRNRLNEVVQRETVSVRVLEANKLGGYEDVLDLGVAPIAPGQSRNLRLVLEHVSSDWNRTFPELQFVNLKYK